MQTPLPRLTAPFVALLSVALCAVGLCAFAADQADAAGRYVAFGDSNSTGSGLDGTNTTPGSPPLCYQTQNSYPAFVASILGYSDFASATCAAAGIREFTLSQPLYNGSWTPSAYAPPQFDKLNGTETLVSITIGGNDSGYGTYAAACLENTNPSATPCKDSYVSNGVNALVESARNGITNRLGAAIDQIHTISPNAEVWVIGYPRMTPVDVSNCPGKIGISSGDAPVFNAWQVALNDFARAETEAHDAYFVDVFTPSEGHDGCQTDTAARWSNPGQAATTTGWSLHPTLNGQTAMASLFINAFNSPRPVRPIKPGPDGKLPIPIGQTLDLAFRSKKVRSVRSSLAPITKTAPAKHGAKLAVTLSRSATVEFLIDRAKPGRIRKGKCRSMSTRAGKGRKACTRYVTAKSKVSLALPGGTSNVYFTGRAGGKQLSEGKYRLRAVLGALSAKTPTFKLSN